MRIGKLDNSVSITRCSERIDAKNCSIDISSSSILFSAPTEIRTPVLALKGLRPSPLDDGGVTFLFDCSRPFYPTSHTTLRDCNPNAMGAK
jgi:hypothetical protein